MDKGHGQDDTGSKVLSELNSKSCALVVTDHHGQRTTESSDNSEDQQGHNVVPDHILAMIVIVGITSSGRSMGVSSFGVVMVMVSVVVTLLNLSFFMAVIMTGMVVVVVVVVVVVMVMARGCWG